MTNEARSAKDALAWMESLQQSGRQVLYRGQSRVWPTIKASIARDCDGTRRVMWQIVRAFCARGASHVTGYSIGGMHNRLSILQHYIGRSPIIDLTGTPTVALYFPIKHAVAGVNCVVYAVDRQEASSDDVVFTDHFFLALPTKKGGAMHRWLRQNGFSVGPRCWWDPTIVQEFDMLKLPGVSSFEFSRQAGDESLVKGLGNLENIDDDPLALSVRDSAQGIAKSLNLWDDKIANIFNSSTTIDPDAVLRARMRYLRDLRDLAVELNAQEELSILKELTSSLERNVWDTGYTVGLWEVEGRLHALSGDGGVDPTMRSSA